MRIVSYQKITLTDYPGQVAALCFSKGCQLRCPFCHNPDLVLKCSDRTLEEPANMQLEFLDYLEKRRSVLGAVVISGGEPLIQKDILSFIEKIKSMGFLIKIDTNGLEYDTLRKIVEKGLVDYVALDYKNHTKKWALTTGMNNEVQGKTTDEMLYNWRASLQLLQDSNIKHEIRTTVVHEYHCYEDLERMVYELEDNRSSSSTAWYLQRFQKKGMLMIDYIEPGKSLSAYSVEEMNQITDKLSLMRENIVYRNE